MKFFNFGQSKASNFPFDEAQNVAVLTCVHVLERKTMICHVSHDIEDGMWQFLCRRAHKTNDARIVGLGEIYNLDKSIGELSDLPCGFEANRKENKWTICPSD